MQQSTPISQCLNCGSALDGSAFCRDCGQRNLHGRLRFMSLLEDINSQLLELDLPWLRTMRDLTLRPGRVCSDYVAGHRIVYVNPLKYFLYVSAIAVFLLRSATWDSTLQLLLGVTVPEPVTARLPAAFQVVLTNLPLYLLLMSPLAIVLCRSLFWRSNRNFVETACFAFFIIAHMAIIVTLLSFVSQLLISHFPNALDSGLLPGALAFLIAISASMYASVAAAHFFHARLDWAFVATLLSAFIYFWALVLTQQLVISVYVL